MCRSNLLQSQPASRVACHLMPAVPADARAATSVVGWGTGHHPSATIRLSLPVFFLLFPLLQSLHLTCLTRPGPPLSPPRPPPPPPSLSPPPSSFSLLCTDTLVESAHYALRWPCIAFYIWHKAVNDTEKREHVKRLKKKKEKEVPRYKGVSWTL